MIKLKKILGILLACLFLTGCNQKETKLDFTTIKNELNALTVNEETIFTSLKEYSEEDLKNIYSIDSNLTEEMHFMQSEDTNNASMYIIALPKEGKEKEIQEQINTFFESFELQADMYNPENAVLIKNRMETKIGNYLIYIVSSNNNKVLEIIKK